MQGIQCLDCRNFYEAVGTWGHQGGAMPACGHALLPGVCVLVSALLMQEACLQTTDGTEVTG